MTSRTRGPTGWVKSFRSWDSGRSATRPESRVTDLPFKIGDSSIVILRSLPVFQCRQCGDTELEQVTMARVDQLLAAVDGAAELEVIRYAA